MFVQLVSFYLLLFIACAAGLYFLLRGNKDRYWFASIFLLALLMRLVLILVVNVGLFGNVFEHPDSEYYVSLADDILEGRESALKPSSASYFFVLLFWLFGRHVSVVEVANSALASFGLLFISLVASRLFGARAGRICSLLLLMDPAFNYWTIQVLKEGTAVFLIGAAVLSFYELKGYSQFLVFPFIFFMLWVLQRTYFAFILIGVMLVVSVLRRECRFMRVVLFTSVCLWFFAGAVAPAFNSAHNLALTDAVAKVVPVQENGVVSKEDLVKARRIARASVYVHLSDAVNSLRRRAEASHHPFFNGDQLRPKFTGFVDLVSFFPVGVPYAIFVPFPWHSSSLFEWLFSISTVYWYALIPFVLLGFLFSIFNKDTYLLSGFALGMFTLLAYVVPIVAPLVRWRLPALLVLYPFAAYSLDRLTSGSKFGGSRIAILGSRGIPARYGGFETFAERLGIGLAKRDFAVTVFCPHDFSHFVKSYKGVSCVKVLNPERFAGSLGTILFDFFSLCKAAIGPYDVVFMLGYSSSVFCWIPRLFGKVVFINMDGLEWKREKWGFFARRYLLFCEWFAVKVANGCVADSKELRRYYRERYGIDASFIAYGADIVEAGDENLVRRLGLVPGSYFLVLARLEPENSIGMIVDAFIRSGSKKILVVVGSRDTWYARSLPDDWRVRYLGGIFDERVTHALWVNSIAYIHGHTVGGTNPALLSAMGCGCAIFARDTVFNREVLGGAGVFFGSREQLSPLFLTRKKFKRNVAAQRRINEFYTWDLIVDEYASLFAKGFK